MSHLLKTMTAIAGLSLGASSAAAMQYCPPYCPPPPPPPYYRPPPPQQQQPIYVQGNQNCPYGLLKRGPIGRGQGGVWVFVCMPPN